MNDDGLYRVSPVRVAVRPDFEALDIELPEGAPTRTDDGKAWVRWAKYGSFSGWYAAGSRKPPVVGQPTFWEAVFVVACECAGGTIDQVHCCGRGVLALGGLGVTLRSSYAQLLLHCCLLANPARYVEVMAPAIQTCGAYTKRSDKSPSGVALCSRGKYAMSEEQMRALILKGSDSVKWTNGQRERAKVWVSCCSQLLRDEAMDQAQMAFLQEVAPALMTEATKVALKWPRALDWTMYIPSQRMLWALALVLSLEDELQTERLVLDAVAAVRAVPDGPIGSEHVVQRMAVEVHESHYEDSFRKRCLLAGRLLKQYLQVSW